MSERLAFSPFEFDRKQTNELRKIGKKALQMETDRYCSGYPHFRGGSVRKLLYNNGRHNLLVGRDSRRMAREEGLDIHMQNLAQTTGEAHDWRQLRGRGTDEDESAKWLESRLLAKQLFTPAVAKLAGKAIRGTEPRFLKGSTSRVIGQVADHFDYDTREEELFVKSVTSADFGELYVPMGLLLSHFLYAQRKGAGPGQVPQLDGFKEFTSDQAIFIDKFRHPLRSADRVLPTHRRQIIKATHFIAEEVRDDRMGWDEVIDFDKRFAKNPNMKLR